MFRWNSLQIERLADGLDPDLSLIGDTCMRAPNQTRKSHTGAFSSIAMQPLYKYSVASGISQAQYRPD